MSNLVALGILLVPTAAQAMWSSSGSGSAAGAATIMPSGQTPTARVSGSDVTLIWPASVFPNGDAVAGYIIVRYNAGSGLEAVVGSSCSGVVAGTSCVEHSVPAGNWIYTDTPVQDSWTGTSSPQGDQVTVS